ncbi:hypothetical protein MIR68_010404 [Amoeboaphelidium protococcarum]|nr:hypothetical protein MIR68_010404 [Amoeboaphelidium protococcarum]
MGFTNLHQETGLAVLNEYLKDKSYIVGFVPSVADLEVIAALHGAPDAKFNNALRWYKQITSYSEEEKKSFPGEKKGGANAYGPSETEAKAAAADEDDLDLFGSDDEEQDAEAEKEKQKRLAEYNARKAAKPKVIAKSSIVLDVKPWDDETDMKALEEGVRKISMDGLLWGASKLVPVGYGIRKLQIMCVVEDDKVSVDDLSDQILELEDYAQSVDVAAFQKI